MPNASTALVYLTLVAHCFIHYYNLLYTVYMTKLIIACRLPLLQNNVPVPLANLYTIVIETIRSFYI